MQFAWLRSYPWSCQMLPVSSGPLSPWVDLCMLEAFPSSCVQDSSLVMYPLRLTYSPGGIQLRPVLHMWPSVPGLALRSTGRLWTVVQKQTCNLVLVADLQAGLAGTHIYLSVYLKEFWFKFFSLNLFYLFCVCVLFNFILFWKWTSTGPKV